MSRELDPPRFLDPDPAINDRIVRLADGREFVDVDVALPPDQIEEIRQGYRCIRCYEPQEEAWPKVCESKLPNGQRWCNFPIRDLQAHEYAATYGGEVQLGSRINMADEAERLKQMDEFESRTGIILPNKEKFPDGPI